MTSALVLSVRFHDGRYHGRGDWPPAPSRLFQALTAAAARGDRIPQPEADALRWLEALPPPRIAAPRAVRGQAFETYVPNNDIDAKGGDVALVAEIRVAKTMRPLLFDAEQPIIFVWETAPSSQAEVLTGIARRLHRLGLGLDMAWADAALMPAAEAEALLAGHRGAVHRPTGAGEVPCPAPGTLDTLIARFDAALSRLTDAKAGRKSVTCFAQPPKARFRAVGYDRAPQVALYDLCAPAGGLASPHVTTASAMVEHLREAAIARIKAQDPSLSGHAERFFGGRGAGPDDRDRRVRLIPLPSVGHRHVTPALRRIRVEVPHDCPLDPRDVFWAVGGVHWHADAGDICWELAAAEDQAMAARYVRPARLWRSVTPLALRGSGRGEGRLEAERLAFAGLRRGLRLAQIHVPLEAMQVQREPWHERGARADAFLRPARFGPGDLWHAELRFAEPVHGPLILGDGRFVGLGLFEPHAVSDRAFALQLISLPDGLSPVELAQVARRAVMGAWRTRHGDRLPDWLSGHEPDGAPLARGARLHVAVHADPARRRILVLPPADLGPDDRDALRSVLQGMERIVAGRAGVAPAQFSALCSDDPCLAASRAWESVTDWTPMRHRKTGAPETDVAEDVSAEHRLRGLPEPECVEILSLSEGRRGGVSARLRLRYRVVVEGPLMLGRRGMKGGGLFVGCEE